MQSRYFPKPQIGMTVLTLVLSLSTVSSAAKPRLAIVDFTPRTGVSGELAALITDALRADIYQTGAFEMIDRRAVPHILNEAKLQQFGITAETESYVGQVKNIDKLILGSVGKVDGRYILAARRVDIVTARDEIVLAETNANSITDVLTVLTAMANKLAGNEKRRTLPVRTVAVMAFSCPQLHDTSVKTTLGEIISNALVQGLSDDPSLHVLSPYFLGTRLARMDKKYVDSADPSVATRLAQDVGANRVVSGNITKLGKEWIITSVLTDVASGRTIKSSRSSVTTLDDILTRGMDQHLSAIRMHLTPGSDRTRISGMTTSSAEAYRLYIQGHDAFMVGQYKEAVTWLRRATSIDPDFAMAHTITSCAYSFLDQKEASQKAMDKAMSYYDHLSAKEKLWLKADEAWVKNDLDMLKLYYLHFTRLYPDDARGWLYLGLAEHWKLNDLDAAVRAYDRALEFDSSSYPLTKAKVDALEALGDKKQARSILTQYISNNPKSYHQDNARHRLTQLGPK